MNRQESHRIYLQLFAPRSSSASSSPPLSTSKRGTPNPEHRHGSHDIHPPNYPTTTPGAPYQFSSSSEDLSTVSSYSFSSLSNFTPTALAPTKATATTTNARHTATTASQGNNGQQQQQQHCPTNLPPPQVKNRFVGYPSTVTTSAAVRLTDKAKSKDVTALLRGKFGLPTTISISSSSSSSNATNNNNNNNNEGLISSYQAGSERIKQRQRMMPTRLSQVKKDGGSNTIRLQRNGYNNHHHHHQNNNDNTLHEAVQHNKEDNEVEEIDALVLIGTIERPPKGYLRFEHEEFMEEKERLEKFRHFHNSQQQQQQQQQQHLPVHRGGMPSSIGRMNKGSEDAIQTMGNHTTRVATGMMMAHHHYLPISESAATVQASGGQPGWASSTLLNPSASGEGSKPIMMDTTSASGSGNNPSPIVDGGGMLSSSSGAIGLDLSSSRWCGGAGTNRTTSWGALRGIGGADGSVHRQQTQGDIMDDYVSSSSRGGGGKATTLPSELSAVRSNTISAGATASPPLPRMEPPLSSPPQSIRPIKSPNACYQHDMEPIHIVRTVLPNEHPLHVRDEMMALLGKLRQEAEEEMGFYLREGDFQPHYPQPTFRWYFQPCSPLGGSGSGLPSSASSSQSPKIQSIPAYIDVEGYCTEDESESDDEDDDDDNDDVNTHEEAEEGMATKPIASSQMRQLIEERQRIAILRDLTDPSFLVSGYLLKQSGRDPNVWRRVYCVVSEDRMWTIGRMKPLKKKNGSSSKDVVVTTTTDVDEQGILSSIRVGRHKYFKLHRSLLLERGDGVNGNQQQQSTSKQSSSRYNSYHLTSPLDHRLPNTFRILTCQGKCHTFRAFNSQSFRVWVSSLSEKIAQKHGDGMMDLANVIAEEETLARCRRMDDIAVAPLRRTTTNTINNEAMPTTTTTEFNLHSSSIPMDVVRFGIAVAAFRELCRHVNDAIRQHKNHHGNVVNVQTRVGSRTRQQQQQAPSSPTAGHRAKNMEHAGMVASAWDEARMVSSKSAQLLHALATLQHDVLNDEQEGDDAMPNDSKEEDDDSTVPERNIMMEELIEEQKSVQALLGKHWDHHNNMDDTTASNSGAGLSLPPIRLFDPLLEKLQTALLPTK